MVPYSAEAHMVHVNQVVEPQLGSPLRLIDELTSITYTLQLWKFDTEV